MNFAEKLKAARTAAGLSQHGMADRMLIPFRTIQQWEGGQRTPPPYVQRFVLNELEEIAADPLVRAEREGALDNLKKMMASHEAWKANHPRSKYDPEDERIKEDLEELKRYEDKINEARMEELHKAPRISEEKRKELEERLAAGEKLSDIFNPKRTK